MNINLDFFNKHAILILVIIFLLINLFYKNIINILILIISFLLLRNCTTDNNALIIGYVLTLLYGIINNFHLLENFNVGIAKNKPITEKNIKNLIDNIIESDNKAQVLDISSYKSNNTNKAQVLDIDSYKSNNTNKELNDLHDTNLSNKSQGYNKKSNKRQNKKSNNTKESSSVKVDSNFNIDELITYELINQFISKIKSEDDLLIEKKEKNIYDLKPTQKFLSNNRISLLKKKALRGVNIIDKPIIISKDNFIIYGHHIWFAKKSLIEGNVHGYVNNSLYNEKIKTVKINYDIDKLIKKLTEYKITYNKENISKNIHDRNNINKGKKMISDIRKNLKKLEENYNQINNMELL